MHAFLASIDDPMRRKDARAAMALMKSVTGERPEMWGSSIVGFGSYRLRYASGRESDWMLAGFSPRARDLTFYLMTGFTKHGELLGRLGKHSKGKACLHVRRLAEVDVAVLEELVRRSVSEMRSRYPPAGPMRFHRSTRL